MNQREQAVIRFSIVIPAYNESKSICGTLDEVYSFFEGADDFEIIVVDDASADDTAAIVSQFAQDHNNVRLMKNATNRGKGFCVRSGVSRACGDVILITDADMSIHIRYLAPFHERMQEGCDIVIASRYLPGSVLVRPLKIRQAMGRVFNFLTRKMLGLNYSDTQCGFKLMRADLAKEIFSQCRTDRFSIDVEMLMTAGKLEARVVEFPVTCINSPTSKIRIVRDSSIMLRDILTMYLRERRKGNG